MGDKRKTRGSLVGPVILIGFGVLFLLSNLGFLEWGIWETLARLWPLFLVAAGLDLVFGRASAWVGVLIGLVVLAIVTAAAFGSFNWWGRPATWRTARTERIAAPLDGAASAEVVVKAGVGKLRVSALSDSTNLVEGQLDLAAGEGVQQESRISDGKAFFSLRKASDSGVVFGGVNIHRLWDIRVARTVPVSLTIHTGVGQSDIDLGEIRATNVEIKTGIGNTSVTMPRLGSVRATVEGGIGKTSIVIPRGMAARITAKKGLGSVDVRGDYERDDDEYVSPDYYQAVNRLDLKVSSGIGSIDISRGW